MLESLRAMPDAGCVLGWIRTTRGVKTFLCTIGFWALGLGLVLVVEGHAPAGGVLAASGAGVLWAVGYWVQPWGEPGWYRRVLRAWNDWSGSVKVAQGTAQR